MDIADAENLCSVSTAGPWEVDAARPWLVYSGSACICDVMDDQRNAAFIAASRSLVPHLCSEVRTLRGLLRGVMESEREIDVSGMEEATVSVSDLLSVATKERIAALLGKE